MIRRCLCVLLYILSSMPAVAALNIESVKFEERMLASNLPFGDIRAIVHSRDGFIWIGGEAGLFRYDGYEYLPIVTASIDGESQKLRRISVIFEDSRGQIWVAAATGLMRLDRNYNRLVATALSPAGEITINVLRELPDGTLLIGASEGLFKLNPLDYSIKTIINKDRLDGLDEPVVVDIWIQHVRDIWLATPKGLAHYNSETDRLTKITIPGLEHIQANLFTRVVTGGEQGTIWLGTSQGLVNYDPHSHTAKIYAHQPGIASSLANHLIWDIHVDGSGDVWVATDGGGLNYLRAGTDQFVRHQQTPNRKGSIHSNVIRVITQDHHGDLWFGHYPSGISYLDRSLLGIRHIGFTGERHGLTHNSVMSIARDERGNLWLGTDGGGINYLDLQAGTFTPFTHDPNDPATLASNAVLDLYLEGNTLWAGTWNGGLNKLDTLSGKVTRYPYIRRKTPGFSQDVQLYSNSVWRINADAEGDLWLATHGGGIAYFDPKLAPGTAVFQQYNQDPRHNQGLPAEVAWALEPLPDGNMVIGTANGACRFTKAAGNCPRLPGTGEFMREWVVDIERVGDTLWFASEDGLYRYHLPSQSLTRIGQEDGLADTSVRALAVDDQQRIWLGTKQGISLIDEDNQKITNFERHQGQYIGAINRGAAARTADGELVFGGVNGLFIVNPKTLNSPPPPPTPQLTSAAVFTELVQASSGSTILDKVVNRAQAIHLTHEQRMLTLSFSALNFRDADLNTYAYKLEGFDNDW